mgnify:CR=1 FL=1
MDIHNVNASRLPLYRAFGTVKTYVWDYNHKLKQQIQCTHFKFRVLMTSWVTRCRSNWDNFIQMVQFYESWFKIFVIIPAGKSIYFAILQWTAVVNWKTEISFVRLLPWYSLVLCIPWTVKKSEFLTMVSIPLFFLWKPQNLILWKQTQFSTKQIVNLSQLNDFIRNVSDLADGTFVTNS